MDLDINISPPPNLLSYLLLFIWGSKMDPSHFENWVQEDKLNFVDIQKNNDP